VEIDFTPTNVKKINAIAPGLNAIKGDVFNLEFEDNYFGAYCSWGVVEHYEEGPQPIIKEAYRVLKTDGYLLVSVPFFNPVRSKMHSGMTSTGNGEFYQYAFDEREFSVILGKE